MKAERTTVLIACRGRGRGRRSGSGPGGGVAASEASCIAARNTCTHAQGPDLALREASTRLVSWAPPTKVRADRAALMVLVVCEAINEAGLRMGRGGIGTECCHRAMLSHWRA